MLVRRQTEKLCEAMRWEKEEKKEAERQQRIRKAEQEAHIRKAYEEANVKSARLQGVRDVARGNLIQGIMAGEGEKLSGTHMNSQVLFMEENGGHVYVAQGASGGVPIHRRLFSRPSGIERGLRSEGGRSSEGTNATRGSG